MIKLIPFPAVKAFLHLFGSPLCTGESLPPTDFNFCTPDIRTSEIRRIFIARVGAVPFVDWSNGAEWAFRLVQSGGNIDAIRTLWVIGDKPAPTAKRVVISGGRKVTVRKDHVIHATIDDVNQTNHDFVMGLGMGKNFRVWYETMGGFMFGGNDGIVTLFQADMVLLRGQGEIMTYQATLDWNNLSTEDKCISPIFDDVAGGECGDITGLAVTDSDYYSLTIEWDLIPGADFYQYQVTGGDYDSGIVTTHLTSITTVPVLSPDTEYTVTVRAICSNGAFGEWATTTGSTIALPECGLVTDLEFGTVTSTSITFSWNDPLLTGTYQYQVGGSDGYDSGVIDTTETSITVTGLTPETIYTVTVWNVCEGFPSDSLQIGVTTPAPVLPVVVGLVAYYASFRGITTDGLGNVYGWADSSGNGNNLEALGVNPTIENAYFPSGERAIKFTSGGMQTPLNIIGGLNGSSEYTILIVSKMDSPAGAKQIITQYSNTADISTIVDGFEVSVLGTTYTFGHWGNVGLNKITVGGANTFNGKIIRIDKHQTATNEALGYSWQTGVAGSIGTGTGANNTNEFGDYKLTIGSAADNNAVFAGEIGAIAIWKRRLNVTEVLALKDFFNDIFGF